jgi:hypothetical protein
MHFGLTSRTPCIKLELQWRQFDQSAAISMVPARCAEFSQKSWITRNVRGRNRSVRAEAD